MHIFTEYVVYDRNNYTFFAKIKKNIRLKCKFMRFCKILGRFDHCKINFLVKFWIDYNYSPAIV